MNKIIKNILFPLSKVLPDKIYLTIEYWYFMGEKINWNNPKTYNEKIQWLKINDRNPLYTSLVDKYEVKQYMEQIIGKEYIIPTYGVWDSYEDIPFNELPNEFVLKCTHDSGSVFLIKDKNTINHDELKKTIKKSLNNNFYWFGREWPYKNIKPRIIAEYMLKHNGDILDYKVFSFNGKAKALFVASDRNNKDVETKFDFYNIDFEPLNIINGHPNSGKKLKRPANLKKMIELTELITKGIPQARVDFYEVDKKLYFGEITFFHWSGFKRFEPNYWDEIFGDWIDLNCLNNSRSGMEKE